MRGGEEGENRGEVAGQRTNMQCYSTFPGGWFSGSACPKWAESLLPGCSHSTGSTIPQTCQLKPHKRVLWHYANFLYILRARLWDSVVTPLRIPELAALEDDLAGEALAEQDLQLPMG